MTVSSVAQEYGLKVGETIPPFSAPDQFGRTQTLETMAGPAGTVIAFRAQRGLVTLLPVIRWKAGTFGNVSTHGTVSMFEKEGFTIVAPLGGTKFQTNVLMRRSV